MKNPEIGYRPTWAEVNLGNLEYNFRQVKSVVGLKVKVMATVKADAYGHGLLPVARRLAASGVDYFGVASIDEGIRLREAGIENPILILGMVLKNNISALFDYGLSVTVCDDDLVSALEIKGASCGKAVGVHIKVDTGMGRLGVAHEDAFGFIKRIYNKKFVKIHGLFTHFAFADINRDFTMEQIAIFGRLVTKLKKRGILIPLLHAANSMGIIGYKQGHFNMVRPGLVLYGLYPTDDVDIKLKPVLSLKSRVVYVKRMPKDKGISYGHTYITKKDTNIAVLPIGYGDGYPRNLSNLAPVLIKGRKFHINGRICMDQVMVDVGSAKIKIGDEAILIGNSGKNKITAEDLAGLSATIPYEIVCGLGSRIPRVYIG